MGELIPIQRGAQLQVTKQAEEMLAASQDPILTSYLEVLHYGQPVSGDNPANDRIAEQMTEEHVVSMLRESYNLLSDAVALVAIDTAENRISASDYLDQLDALE